MIGSSSKTLTDGTKPIGYTILSSNLVHRTHPIKISEVTEIRVVSNTENNIIFRRAFSCREQIEKRKTGQKDVFLCVFSPPSERGRHSIFFVALLHVILSPLMMVWSVFLPYYPISCSASSGDQSNARIEPGRYKTFKGGSSY